MVDAYPQDIVTWRNDDIARSPQVSAYLRAGDVVLSGALGPMVLVASGSRVTAGFSSLGEVSKSFS